MQQITTVAGLKNAIQILEIEQNARKEELKEQLHLTYESLRPVNIIRSTLKELFSMSDNIPGTALGAAGGFLLKKLLVGSSGGVLKRLIGTVLQLGITNIASHKSDAIKSLGLSLFQRIFHKKERISEGVS
jgi:hypothetical protein